MSLHKLIVLTSLLSVGVFSCGTSQKDGAVYDEDTDADADEMALDGARGSSAEQGRLKPGYTVDIKCGSTVAATLSGYKFKPNSVVLPSDRGRCYGVLKSIKLHNKIYTARSGVVDADFASGAIVPFIQAGEGDEVVGIMVRAQIGVGVVEPGVLEFSAVRFEDKKCLKNEKFKTISRCGFRDFKSVVDRHMAAMVSISYSFKPPEVIAPPAAPPSAPGDTVVAK